MQEMLETSCCSLCLFMIPSSRVGLGQSFAAACFSDTKEAFAKKRREDYHLSVELQDQQVRRKQHSSIR